MKTQTLEKRLYTLKLASIYMSMPISTIRTIIGDGEMKFVRREKQGRTMYLTKDEMDSWIDKNTTSNSLD
jgi:hypothetical protein